MDPKEIELSNGTTLKFLPLTAMDALRMEDQFGADALTDAGTSGIRKGLGVAWRAYCQATEDPVGFEAFCELVPFGDMPRVVEVGTLFLETPSAKTKRSS